MCAMSGQYAAEKPGAGTALERAAIIESGSAAVDKIMYLLAMSTRTSILCQKLRFFDSRPHIWYNNDVERNQSIIVVTAGNGGYYEQAVW